MPCYLVVLNSSGSTMQAYIHVSTCLRLAFVRKHADRFWVADVQPQHGSRLQRFEVVGCLWVAGSGYHASVRPLQQLPHKLRGVVRTRGEDMGARSVSRECWDDAATAAQTAWCGDSWRGEDMSGL